MKKQIAILLIALLIVTPAIQGVTASKTVFLTSDLINNKDADLEMLTSIKGYIEDISGGELQVIVDNEAPAAGEGWRAIAVTSDVSVCFSAADAGNYLQLASAVTNSSKQIIMVNTGDYDLDNHSNFLRRAWDDNYSNESLAGMHDPGTFLKTAGIFYIQPAKEFPDNYRDGNLDHTNDEMNKKIAQQIVDIATGTSDFNGTLSDDLLTTNKISPAGMASASKELVNSGDKELKGPYGAYSTPQLLYQTSCYLNGNGIDIPREYGEPEDPQGISILTRDTYSVYDYFKMGGIVKNYMDENGRAPDSIEYEGAHISYYDLVYNFAKITQNHTDAEHMGFENEYHFDKVNDSILLHIFPIVLILLVLFAAYKLYGKLRRFR
ncbi:adhesin [Methanobrevibacter sp. YE315]|uniref:adhesin n=1 Tax=Methanobrevibacter sp. YE315 TaxID=1609968 RepID=UPI000764D12B|nr:adhesin [Methanobrevibacter sp. YE315]AMD17052.1 adhesin [Methanobrevibacter sp. YE315]